MRNAVTQRYYVSVAGNPRQTNYLFSIGYNGTEGIIKTTGFQNVTVRLNVDRSFGKPSGFQKMTDRIRWQMEMRIPVWQIMEGLEDGEA